jgi:hypothetical protein
MLSKGTISKLGDSDNKEGHATTCVGLGRIDGHWGERSLAQIIL